MVRSLTFTRPLNWREEKRGRKHEAGLWKEGLLQRPCRGGCGTAMEETDFKLTTASTNPTTRLRFGTFFHIPGRHPHVAQ